MFYDFSRKKLSIAILISFFLSVSIFLTTVVTKKLGDDFFRINLVKARMAFNAFRYKVNFAQANDKNLTASILSSIQDDNLILQFNRDKAQSIPVLLYHGIIDKPDGANILLENFKNQMFTLKKAGWQTVSIEDFNAFVKGWKELPDRSFLLTFDDGRKDSYYPADPLLKALDYRVTIFVITEKSLGETKRNFYLSEDELKQMIKSGRWDVQAHTYSGHDIYKIAASGEEGHFYSNKLWLEDKHRVETEDEFVNRAKSDLMTAKNSLEQKLGVKVIAFAYPFGDFGQNSVNFPATEAILPNIVQSIYPLSFYQVWPGRGFNFDYPGEDASLVKRINVNPDWGGGDLLGILENGREKNLPYEDNFDRDNGWTKSWGKMAFEDKAIKIGSHAGTTGSLVFLDGSNLWGNYVFKSRVDLIRGQVFSLLARYKNDNNYVACVFTTESIRIEQMANGERRVVRELKGNFESIGNNREVGIGAYDDKVNCYVDGKITLEEFNSSAMLEHGGIGFKTWDPTLGNSELILKSVSVEEIK